MNFLQERQFVVLCAVCEFIFIVLFAIFADYSNAAKPIAQLPQNATSDQFSSGIHYSMFVDAHTMIFIGFAYIMTFLKRYGYSSIAINFIIASFVIQWSLIVRGLFFLENGVFKIGLKQMLLSDSTVAAVLFSMGVMLGKLTPVQYILMALIETVFAVLNEYVYIHLLQAVDIGGSLTVHAYGSFFGLGIARAMHRKEVIGRTAKAPVYHSDMFSILGTLILWTLWPSFNAFLASPPSAQLRTALNTILALNSASVTSLLTCAAVHGGKLCMLHAQTGALAGGVAIGTASNLLCPPFLALVCGCAGAAISTLTYQHVSPMLAAKFKMHDTCGITNVHGWPALVAVLVTAGLILGVDTDKYGDSLPLIFSAMQNDGWSRTHQALMQVAGAGVVIFGGFLAGSITGFILDLKIWNQVSAASFYEDEPYWNLPECSDPYLEQIDETENKCIKRNKGNGKEIPIEIRSISVC